MNIFVLDLNPSLASKMHCDKHVVKMILETAQILSTVQFLLGKHEDWMYKPTHSKHPCVIWAKECRNNYIWLYELGLSLCEEYTHRYGKQHKSSNIIRRLCEKRDNLLEFTEMTPFTLAMPDDCKDLLHLSDGAVRCYRKYYIVYKHSICKWTKREKPYWYNA